MSSLKDDKTPCARLCHIVKWDDFDGYGFNLHAEKGKNGQFIGKVDDGSPSQAAGLRQGDRIVEVNEINIANESHKQVVERIKAFPNETKLLVVDQEADEHFKANNIIIKGTMANVKVIKTPEKNPHSVENNEERSSESVNSYVEEDKEKSVARNEMSNSNNPIGVSTPSIAATIASTAMTITTTTTATTTAITAATVTTLTTATTTTTTTTLMTTNESITSDSVSQREGAARENGNSVRNIETMVDMPHHGTGNGDAMGSMSSSDAGDSAGGGDTTGITIIGGSSDSSKQQGLNLKMSAKELRAQLAARKKYDPKKESIGFKDKFDIVQKL